MVTIYNQKYGYKFSMVKDEELKILSENKIPINFKNNKSIYIKEKEDYFKAVKLLSRES